MEPGGLPAVGAMLNQLPHAVLLINRRRQIVYANPAAAPLFPDRPVEDVVGMRIGEAVNCRIISKTLGNDMDLRVWAVPLSAGGERLTLFTLVDISDEKRREMLERVFFHDVLNTAGGSQGMASLYEVASAEERDEMSGMMARLSGTLIEELQTQQSVTPMEHGDLFVRREPVSSLRILRAVAEAYRNHWATGDCCLAISPESTDAAFDSDPALLRRVIGNMTKNALEACPAGGTVTLSCSSDAAHVSFRVHNATAMPRSTQLQLFQRSFSTKGQGRGLGTYSMKLLSERYLNGHVSFVSSPEHGTTFVAAYRRDNASPGSSAEPGTARSSDAS